MSGTAPFRLVLASASPQRHKILRDAGYEFELADPGDTEENICSAATPEALATLKAHAKAGAVAARWKGARPALVLGVDTLVALGAEVIGKPVDRNDAVSILTRLSGTRHRCISGLCLWPVRDGTAPAPVCDAVTTWVQMMSMSAAQIAAYVASGQSDGKAGAYAIQANGDEFVQELQGSFLNVVGFPLEHFQALLPRLLKQWQQQ